MMSIKIPPLSISRHLKQVIIKKYSLVDSIIRVCLLPTPNVNLTRLINYEFVLLQRLRLNRTKTCDCYSLHQFIIIKRSLINDLNVFLKNFNEHSLKKNKKQKTNKKERVYYCLLGGRRIMGVRGNEILLIICNLCT